MSEIYDVASFVVVSEDSDELRGVWMSKEGAGGSRGVYMSVENDDYVVF